MPDRRRWFQDSLRAFLVLVTCIALATLDLSSTKITDRVFDHFAKMPNLTAADLHASRGVSTEAVQAFEAAHPKCDIGW
jgi:hypothetical protein